MKTFTIIYLITTFFFLMACNDLSINGKSADSIRLASDDKTQIKIDSAGAMKAWMDFKTPGALHKMLAKANGQWKEEITTWEAPGAPPQKTTGTCVNTMILDGRYQQSVNKGTMMGMPFEGISTVGYDNCRREFVLNWIDNMGTGFMQMNGAYDSIAKTIHFKGTMTDPTSGRQTDVREDFKLLSDGNQLLEMYGSQAIGKPEFKVMEIRFSRK